MNSKDEPVAAEHADDEQVFREILGYLNFSSGTPDAGFQRNLNRLRASFGADKPWSDFQNYLRERLGRLQSNEAAFADSQQANAVIQLVFDECLPAYRRAHADLLFHLSEAAFDQPFFVARMCEAVLAQGPPWEETERVVTGALNKLNDFLGFRPLAVLENGRQMEPYAHERFRPVPLYIKGAGVSVGPYHDVIEAALKFLENAPRDVLVQSYFELDHLDELALDVRAHDHTHPVNKRTNYMFGEWDPHLIDSSGYYRRFVIRKIILDALLSWIHETQDGLPPDELLYDASAVLCGTMLMASAISGSGPDTHDSSVTLTSLLPIVARQRDEFYARLLTEATGDRSRRLQQEAELTQQPFGHVRQYLNMQLAEYGAMQVQHRELARLFARMGYHEAAQEEALEIPSASARFECEMQWRLTAAHLQLDLADVAAASELIAEAEDFLHRGIECGAIVDPWNILGFQAQFPLFASREDSVPDQRVEVLLDVMEQLFEVYSRALGEAAAQGDGEHVLNLSARFETLADFWDRFATTTVEDLPKVSGGDSLESAKSVSQALAEWRKAGESSGDISFWRGHVEQFHTAKAYALVVEALLEKRDHVAAMGLLIQWLSQAEEVGLEAGPHSFHTLLIHWMKLVTERDAAQQQDPWPTLRRLFDYLEANAGEYWSVPSFAAFTDGAMSESTDPSQELWPTADEETDDDEDNLFEAAYEDVIYRDSADDGQVGEMLEGGVDFGNSEFEIINREIEPRLKFLNTLALLWQMAAGTLAQQAAETDAKEQATDEIQQRQSVLNDWLAQLRKTRAGLDALLKDVWSHDVAVELGDHDANIEYDIQLQTKFYILHTAVTTHVNCRSAERSLLSCLPAAAMPGDLPFGEKRLIEVYRGIFRRDADAVRKQLPELVKELSKRPLLYVPFDNGGLPPQVLSARSLQAVMRFLLEQLPRLGLLVETRQLLGTAYRMERTSRPRGHAVTEFDRLFRTSLRSTLEEVVVSVESQKRGKLSDRQLVELVGQFVESSAQLWLKHSQTMRLSHVEVFQDDHEFEDIRQFVSDYGADLFHARLLTLGHVRTILHDGVESFLDFLSETEDPLHPIKLLEDVDEDRVDEDYVVDTLELIYGALVDKFDRFLEYNTTTIQSDYGEKLYTLLDVLRVEAAYERDAWNMLPVRVAHEVLADRQQHEAADMWEELIASKTAKTAEGHLAKLTSVESRYGMRLPSVADHLNERFLKPLAVNRMLALVPIATEDARAGRDSEAFETLRGEIDEYIETTCGSGIDIPDWLRSLEDALDHVDPTLHAVRYQSEPELNLAPLLLSTEQLKEQIGRLMHPSRAKAAKKPSPAKKKAPKKKAPKKKPSKKKPRGE